MAKTKSLEQLAGTMSDTDAAARLGIEPKDVKAYRVAKGIKRHRKSGGAAAAQDTVSPGPTKLLRKRGGEGAVEEVLVDAPPPVAAAPEEDLPPEPEPEAPSTAQRSGRKSASALLDRVKDRLGKVPDDTIADEVGLSRGVVGAYRRKHGIEAYDGYLFKKGHAPLGRPRGETPAGADTREAAPTGGAAPAAEARRGPKSRIEDYAHLLGVQTDAEVARQAGVTRAAVSAWRRNHGISASRGPGGVPRKAEAAPTPRAKAAATPAPSSAAAAPAPAPAASRAAVVENGAHRAYNVVSTAGEHRLEFVAVGPNVSDACARAQSWLDTRRDGPWRIDEVRFLSEAVV